MRIKCLKITMCSILFCIIFSNIYSTSIKNVTVGEVEGIDSEKEESIYDIEISWDNMNFTYNETKDIKWDDKEKEYDIVTENEWINENNKIDIKNFSDKPITISFKYEQTKRGMDIIGKFNKDRVKIDKNGKEKVTFSMTGTITSDKDEYIKVGRITMSVQ